MSSDETEADRNRFTAQPSSFTPSGGSRAFRQSDGGALIFFLTVFHFVLFAGALGVAVHNFYLLSAGLGTGWNWIFAGIGSFVLWFLTLFRFNG